MHKNLLQKSNCMSAIVVTSLMTLGLFSSASSALASGPYELIQRGNDQDFPTWHAGRTTKLCVENLHKEKPAAVKVQAKAAAGPEEIEVPGGETKCIDRGWAGAIVNVVNVREVPVKVWTE